MIVYVVQGGCIGDQHIIAIYDNEQAAKDRVEAENQACKGLEAYIEKWEVNVGEVFN